MEMRAEMRTALFSDRERKLLKEYLEGGSPHGSFKRVLFYRIKKAEPQIREDLALMNEVIAKEQSTPNK